MIPVVSGTMLPISPISSSVSNPNAMALLYLAKYGTKPRRLLHADAFVAIFAVLPPPGLAAAALISTSTSDSRASAPHSENADTRGPSTGTVCLRDSSEPQSVRFARCSRS